MKDFIGRLAFLVCVLIVLPFIILNIFYNDGDINSENAIISVYNSNTEEIMELNLEEYVTCVVAAEMPAVFSQEALKAQAVAARTYAVRKINKDAPEHKGADLCTDFAHCQAYCDTKKMKSNWKDNYKDNYDKIRDCVKSTRGEYLTYNGEAASTVFHSCSDGKTENSVDVWGGEFPYLICVESPGDIEKNDYITEVTYSNEEFVKIINEQLENETSITPDEISIGNSSLTEGGNVNYITICNHTLKGTEVRKLFNLKSASFTVSRDEDNVKFSVYGSGHGVGMSQYGAQAMAKNNTSYKEILSHYYPGTKLENMYKNM